MSEPLKLPDMTYFVVASDPLERRWLTIAINVGGPATVIGRWTTEELANADADKWWLLEAEASA